MANSWKCARTLPAKSAPKISFLLDSLTRIVFLNFKDRRLPVGFVHQANALPERIRLEKVLMKLLDMCWFLKCNELDIKTLC